MKRTKVYPPSVDPGFPELASTPACWRRVTFGDLLEVVARPKKLDSDATYRLVKAKRNRGGITLRAEVLGREVLTKTQFEAKAGDFLISRRQIVHGACGVVPDEMDGAVVSNEYSTLRTRPALLMEFLKHYSHTPYFQRSCFHSSHGVTVEKMIFKLDEWLAREVDVPPLPEQRKIAAILSAAEEVIEKTSAVIETLQMLKKAMMHDMLTRGFPGRHARFKETEIGEIPQEWELKPGKAIFRLAGGYGPSALQFSDAGECLFIKVDDFNAVQNARRIKVSNLRFAASENSRINTYGAGTIVFPKRGAAIFKNRVRLLSTATAVDPNLMVMLPEACLDSEYFAYQLIHIGLFNLSDNSGVPQINNKHLYPTMFRVPPLAEQHAIAAQLAAVDEQIEAEAATRQAVSRTKAALMSVLLTGELRVTFDEGDA